MITEQEFINIILASEYLSSTGMRKIKEYLQGGGNPDIKMESHITPLIFLSTRDPINSEQKELFKLLVDYGADINKKNIKNFNYTPLHYFCMPSPNVEMVEFLLSKGANPNAKSTRGTTPKDEILNCYPGGTSLETINSIVFLLDKYTAQQERLNALPPPYKSPAQIEQEKIDNFEIKELSVPTGWYKQAQRITIPQFVKAIRESNITIVKEYLERGGRPDIPFNPFLQYPNQPYPTPLFYLSRKDLPFFSQNDKEIMEILINYGSDINIQDDGGYTPLHNASWKKNIEAVKLLLAHGANPDIQDNKGATSFYYACWASSSDILKEFLKYNPKLDIPDNFGITPLSIIKNNKEKYKISKPYMELQERLKKLPPPYETEKMKQEKKIKNFEIKELSFKEDWYKTAQYDPQSQYMKSLAMHRPEELIKMEIARNVGTNFKIIYRWMLGDIYIKSEENYYLEMPWVKKMLWNYGVQSKHAEQIKIYIASSPNVKQLLGFFFAIPDIIDVSLFSAIIFIVPADNTEVYKTDFVYKVTHELEHYLQIKGEFGNIQYDRAMLRELAQRVNEADLDKNPEEFYEILTDLIGTVGFQKARELLTDPAVGLNAEDINKTFRMMQHSAETVEVFPTARMMDYQYEIVHKKQKPIEEIARDVAKELYKMTDKELNTPDGQELVETLVAIWKNREQVFVAERKEEYVKQAKEKL